MKLIRMLKRFYLIGFVIGGSIRLFYTLQYKLKRGESGIVEKVLLFLLLLGMQILPLIYVFSSRLDFAAYRLPLKVQAGAGWLGTVIFGEALWVLWRSHADLGRNWTVELQIQEEQTLVTEGLYKHVRHPMYTAHWLWALAQALLLQNWIAGPAMLVTFLPFYLERVPREEQMMLEQFGSEYEAYMTRTGRLIRRL
ncbi:MAG: protein-S-isoprenylcysteine O-methyltransferase [Ardenticatenaceae bacterium]